MGWVWLDSKRALRALLQVLASANANHEHVGLAAHEDVLPLGNSTSRVDWL